MPASRQSAITRSKLIAQDDGAGIGSSGLALLLRASDYEEAVTQALRTFDQDRPNLRVVDVTVVATGFRFALSGAGAFAELTNLNAWIQGQSLLRELIWPWDATAQDLAPYDPDGYRVVQTPTGVALEFLVDRPRQNDVIRLTFTAPHALTDSPSPATCTILDGDVDSFVLLVASTVLQLAAVRAVQNTGTSGLPNDITDRRSQSDQFRARANELYARYRATLGLPAKATVGATSAYFDVDTQPSSGRGYLWPRA